MYYNKYLNENGIEERQIFFSYERVFDADDYLNWLEARDRLSLSELSHMESITERQHQFFKNEYYPYEWHEHTDKYCRDQDGRRIRKSAIPSLAFTHFPKQLIDIIASFAFGCNENGSTNSDGFGTYMESIYEAKTFRSICKSIHAMFPNQRIAEMYCMSSYAGSLSTITNIIIKHYHNHISIIRT